MRQLFGVALAAGLTFGIVGVAYALAPGNPNCVAVGEGKVVVRHLPGGGTMLVFQAVRPINVCRITECSPGGVDLCTPNFQFGPAATPPVQQLVRVFCKCSSDPVEPSGCRTVFEGSFPTGSEPPLPPAPGQWTVSCAGGCPAAGDTCRLTLEPLAGPNDPGLDPVSCLCLPPG